MENIFEKKNAPGHRTSSWKEAGREQTSLMVLDGGWRTGFSFQQLG
jgi:hypothetical protein